MMFSNSVTLSTNDIQRLEPLLTRIELGQGGALPAHLLLLANRIGICTEAGSSEVPADVVTMNSRVRLENLESGTLVEYEVVYPQDADPSEGRISVLSPLGAALVGARVGKIVEVSTPRSIRKLLVRDLVFQPEAAGRYDL